jgi:hypothetical protein
MVQREHQTPPSNTMLYKSMILLPEMVESMKATLTEKPRGRVRLVRQLSISRECPLRGKKDDKVEHRVATGQGRSTGRKSPQSARLSYCRTGSEDEIVLTYSTITRHQSRVARLTFNNMSGECSAKGQTETSLSKI